MNQHTTVDTALVEWGNRIFNSGPVRKKIRKGMTGLRILALDASRAGASKQFMDAKAVRRKLNAIVKRTPQVMVRISGGGKGIRHIKAHLDYISRNGQIPVEDQNGDQLLGKDDIDSLRDEWQFGGFPIADGSVSRQAFNIVLSMPAGTSELAVKKAARDFAFSEFSNFQYVMALHTFETDPDKNPSPNPHVHLCVKATGLDGTRLNPRKDDLQRWREGFAAHLREYGVECEATRRVHRLQRQRSEKQSVRHKRTRGESFDRLGMAKTESPRIRKAVAFESAVLVGYKTLAIALAKSEDPQDRKLALGVTHRFANPEKRPDRDPSQQVDR